MMRDACCVVLICSASLKPASAPAGSVESIELNGCVFDVFQCRIPAGSRSTFKFVCDRIEVGREEEEKKRRPTDRGQYFPTRLQHRMNSSLLMALSRHVATSLDHDHCYVFSGEHTVYMILVNNS